MKTLPTEFRSGGFHFRQLKRTGDVALFQTTAPWASRPFYEVVIVQHQIRRELPNGKWLEAREAMPRSEDWGKYGWSYSDRPSAEARFQERVALRSPRSEKAPQTAGEYQDSGPPTKTRLREDGSTRLNARDWPASRRALRSQ